MSDASRPPQRTGETVAAGSTAAKESSAAPPNTSVDSDIPSAPESHEELCECKPDQTPPWKMIMETGAVLVALGLLIVNSCQLQTSQEYTQVANNTFNQIQQQTTLMRQQLVGSQGAVLLPSPLTFNSVGQLAAGLQNIGHVTSTIDSFQVEASKETIKDSTRIGSSIVFEPVVDPIASERGFSKTWQLPWRPAQLTDKPVWPKGWPGKYTYEFRLIVTYENGFGDKLHLNFCQKWLPGFSIQYKLQSSGGGGMYDCDVFQQSIKSVLEQERKAEQGADRPD